MPFGILYSLDWLKSRNYIYIPLITHHFSLLIHTSVLFKILNKKLSGKFDCFIYEQWLFSYTFVIHLRVYKTASYKFIEDMKSSYMNRNNKLYIFAQEANMFSTKGYIKKQIDFFILYYTYTLQYTCNMFTIPSTTHNCLKVDLQSQVVTE